MRTLLNRKLLSIFLICLIVLGGSYLAWKPVLMEDISFSRAVYDRKGQLLRLTLSEDEKYRLFVPLSSVSPILVQSVLLHEDRYFMKHFGVNPLSLGKAFYYTYLKGGRKIGASTITMQLVRIKYKIHSRNLLGKLWQIILAIRTELHYSKEQILEAYLNLAPFGRNIEGIGAASFIYFGKEAGALNVIESLTLAVVPQSPYRRSPGRNVKADQLLYQARYRLYKQWVREHPEDQAQKRFITLPLTFKTPADLPNNALHFTTEMLHLYKEMTLSTTLDHEIQTMLQHRLSHYINMNHSAGMINAAALLVDFRTMEVVASLGSANFFDSVIKGQVNGVKARRSPGSTLKPFIYTLAFDQGMIHPLSMLKDSPQAYGDFNPENFDSEFLGPISAHDALVKSRNVPTLYVASQLRKPNFYQFLQAAGIGRLKAEETYGLSLALGAAEVTMEELVQLYGALANGGWMMPLKKLSQPYQTDSKKLFSPEAAFLTLDILKDTPLPNAYRESSDVGLPIYWKTGTSNAYRDAWSVGIFGHYILAVWVGDFRGRAQGNFIGIQHAAPLFFSLIHAVIHKEPLRDVISKQAKNLKLTRVKACATTGDINQPLCKVQVSGWFIPGKSPIADSGILTRRLINKDTGKLLCPHEKARRVEYKMIENWPSDVMNFYKTMGSYQEHGNLASVACHEEGERTGKLHITSPLKHISYSTRFPRAESHKIRFSAIATRESRTLYWFVDQQFIGKAKVGEDLFWTPHPGKMTVRVVDDLGLADSREMTILVAE